MLLGLLYCQCHFVDMRVVYFLSGLHIGRYSLNFQVRNAVNLIHAVHGGDFWGGHLYFDDWSGEFVPL